ncbi:MAG: glutamate--tRNA ligase [Cyclobacteriaceae bacterium]|nr:glutamate--tRNA ligase [Cyclobacteriaceae bacterium]
MKKEVRVRFAPSPTGALHIGGVRTALYNYLFAKKNNGTFILRIEDTDQTRYVPGAEEYIKETFKWLGIEPDEGVGHGGPHAPYRQSERKDIYLKYAQQLIDAGRAYYAFDTPEELDAMRERLKQAKADNQVYDSLSRQTMRNSLTLDADEVKQVIDQKVPYVIRLKVDRNQEIGLVDMIRGQVTVSSDHIDDKVLMKSDGMPTYHLANVIDDHLMNISHVIRGEEWLPSAPLHVLLYQYFGWADSMPQFAHLPLLLKPDGNGKLSKRDGDKHGYPVFPLEWTDPTGGEKSMGFREQGYLPEAILNFLAFLGWNPGTEQELFTLHELVQHFSIERINKSGAKFDIEKGKWFNQQYLKNVPDTTLASGLMTILTRENISCSQEKAAAICGLMKERVTFPQEIWTTGQFFFFQPEAYDEKVIQKKWNEEAKTIIGDYAKALSAADTLTSDLALSILHDVLERHGVGAGKVMQALRVAITGLAGGPDLMPVIAVLGKEETIKRIEHALKSI